MLALIDTNILFYALDKKEGHKHEIARDLVKTAFVEGAYVAAQNLAELYHRAKIKFNEAQLSDARTLALAILKSDCWLKISYDEHTVWNVIRKDEPRHDFWDLMIYFTMLENGVTTVISENEDDFKDLEGITVQNPFKTKR